MMRRPKSVYIFMLWVVVLLLWVASDSQAAWVDDGTALCTATGDQQLSRIVTDGSGGAIVTWRDDRGISDDIYAQRVDASGEVRWAADGVALCTAAGDQDGPMIASDGAGGAIITWYDQRSGGWDIYAQRVDASGAVQWTADGVALCTAFASQIEPTIVSDGSGGAIITWDDTRSGNKDIYAQRVNASGAVQWTADGVALCTAAGNQDGPTIASDGAAGAIITWYDYRSGNWDIYAQRVDASGAVQWTADGVPLCTASGDQSTPTITSDGSGGAIAAWYDPRSGNHDIYAQRVDASGAAQWTADGVALCTAAGDQWRPEIASDGDSGAIVTWYDQRSIDHDIYAQRVDALGAPQWTADGVALCTATGSQWSPNTTPDGAGGAIITWYDQRSGNNDVYAQRINALGAAQWTTDGLCLCAATGSQLSPNTAPDGAGGAIITWYDQRSGNWDVYAQRVTHSGTIGSDIVPVPSSAILVIALATGSMAARRLLRGKKAAI